MSIEKFTSSFSKQKLGVVILPIETVQFLVIPVELALWAYLASKPPSWVPNQTEVGRHFSWGEKKTRRIFQGLTSKKLLIVTQKRSAGRLQNKHYHLRLDLASIDVPPSGRNQPVENQPVENDGHIYHRPLHIIEVKSNTPTQPHEKPTPNKHPSMPDDNLAVAKENKTKPKAKEDPQLFIDAWNEKIANPVNSEKAKKLTGYGIQSCKALTRDRRLTINRWIKAGYSLDDLLFYFRLRLADKLDTNNYFFGDWNGKKADVIKFERACDVDKFITLMERIEQS